MSTKLVVVGDGYLKITHEGEHVCDMFALSSHGLWRLRRKGYPDLDLPSREEAMTAMRHWCWAMYHQMPEQDPKGGPVQVQEI